jgi:hypothetical protein
MILWPYRIDSPLSLYGWLKIGIYGCEQLIYYFSIINMIYISLFFVFYRYLYINRKVLRPESERLLKILYLRLRPILFLFYMTVYCLVLKYWCLGLNYVVVMTLPV